MDVIGWAIGPEHRGTEPPLGGRYLLALSPRSPQDRPLEGATYVLPQCFPATTFLPAPEGDPRFFFLRDGIVYVSRRRGEMPVQLAEHDPALGITRLLAFDRQASPLGLLVAARPSGTQDEQIRLLTISDSAILSAELVTADRCFASQEAFFERYSAPRCLDGGRLCLVPDSDRSYLNVQLVRGQKPIRFKDFDRVPVVDAAWAPDGQTYYALVPCSEEGE